MKEAKPINKFTISGGNDGRVPPVPIPNTEVKPSSADGTWLETARESKSPPESILSLRPLRSKQCSGSADLVHRRPMDINVYGWFNRPKKPI